MGDVPLPASVTMFHYFRRRVGAPPANNTFVRIQRPTTAQPTRWPELHLVGAWDAMHANLRRGDPAEGGKLTPTETMAILRAGRTLNPSPARARSRSTRRPATSCRTVQIRECAGRRRMANVEDGQGTIRP